MEEMEAMCPGFNESRKNPIAVYAKTQRMKLDPKVLEDL